MIGHEADIYQIFMLKTCSLRIITLKKSYDAFYCHQTSICKSNSAYQAACDVGE